MAQPGSPQTKSTETTEKDSASYTYKGIHPDNQWKGANYRYKTNEEIPKSDSDKQQSDTPQSRVGYSHVR